MHNSIDYTDLYITVNTEKQPCVRRCLSQRLSVATINTHPRVGGGGGGKHLPALSGGCAKMHIGNDTLLYYITVNSSGYILTRSGLK